MMRAMKTNKTNPTTKYREKMRRAGFRYICMWVHRDDVQKVKAMADDRKYKWLADELAKVRRAGRPLTK
jgi:hypothetical protein